MTTKELFEKYRDYPRDGSHGDRGFRSWQTAIFDRIRKAIEHDEEALAIFEHTLEFAEGKSICADFP